MNFSVSKLTVFLMTLMFVTLSFSATEPPLQKIKHPGAADGLTRIDKDGVYIYDVENPLQNQSSHVRIGAAANPELDVNIIDVNGNTTNLTFDDIYHGASNMSVGFDYEYFFTTHYGKLGVQAGLSAQYAQGHGRLVSNPQIESIEKFSFMTLPLYLGATYRFEYKDKQLLAPYVAGGGTFISLLEKREDTSKVYYTYAPGFYGAGGVLLNISSFDKEMAADMFSEYGISNIWINAEFKTVFVEGDSFSYKAAYIQGGLSFDF